MNAAPLGAELDLADPYTRMFCAACHWQDKYEALMETMTQPKITGYRQLSEEEAALMNEGKELAERCGAYIHRLRHFIPQNMEGPEGGDAEAFKPGSSLDQRWISIGATDLQRGFMAVMRGIAKPTTF